jgi:hypothetical protein
MTRDLHKIGEAVLEAYYNEVFYFTISSYDAASKSASIMASANKLNYYW